MSDLFASSLPPPDSEPQAAPVAAPNDQTTNHYGAAASPRIDYGKGSGQNHNGYTPSRAAGQKAEGWEKRGTVDAALQQQFAAMQEYGTDSNYDTGYAGASRYDAAPGMPADVSFTDMYKAGMVPDFGNTPANNATVPHLQEDNEVFEVGCICTVGT